MSFFGLFGSESKSSSSTTKADVTADQRVATGDVAGTFAAPGASMTSPLSSGGVVSGQGKLTQSTAYGTVNMGTSEAGVQSLVDRLQSGSEKMVTSLAELETKSTQALSNTVSGLTDVVAAAKGEGSAASRYLPYVALGVLALYLWFARKR